MSLFGGQQSNSGSLFGQQNNQQQQQQQQAKPSLFGTPTQSTSAGTLFGASQPQQPASGGLFGGANANNTSQAQTGGGLFGSTTNQQSNQSGSSLFGTGNATNQQSGQQTGGLFGGAAQQQQQQQKPTLSLFGGSTQTPTQNQNNMVQQQKPSLFGLGANTNINQQQQASQPSTSLFGASTTTQSKPFSLSMGQGGAQSTQQTTVPGVKIDLSNLRGTTRFSDLHESIQEEIVKMDNFIQQQISFKEQCDALMPAHSGNVASLAPDVDFVKGRCEAVETGIDNDGAAIKALKGLIASDADDARRAFRAVENLKLPMQYRLHASMQGMPYGTPAAPPASDTAPTDISGSGAAAASTSDASMDLNGYFERTAAAMQTTLASYTTTLSEIEAHITGVEAATAAQSQALLLRAGARSPEDAVRELASVLREFEQGILGVAGRVGALREGAEGVIGGGGGGGASSAGQR